MKYILLLLTFFFIDKFFCQEVIRVSFADSCIITDCKLSVTDLAKLSGICPQTLKKVTAYSIRIVGNGFVENVNVTGSKWGGQNKKKFLKLKPGGKLTFENISGTNYKGEKIKGPVINVQITKN